MKDKIAQRIDHDAQTRFRKVCLNFQKLLFVGRDAQNRLVGRELAQLRYHRGIEHIARTLGKTRNVNNAMFLGMISAFIGYVFCDVGLVFSGDTSGLIPVCVMAVSAVIMAVCGLTATKANIRWLTDYALPISLVAGMISAIPLTSLLGG